MNKLIYFCSNRHTYIYYTAIDIFMGFNPPCKDCLVQNMCINTTDNSYDKQVLNIKTCEKLNRFLKKSKNFKRIRLTGVRDNEES